MLSREEVGQIVREAWSAYMKEQLRGVAHTPFLPWDELANVDREADMRIGDAVVNAAFPKLRTDVERLTLELREAYSALQEYRRQLAHVLTEAEDYVDAQRMHMRFTVRGFKASVKAHTELRARLAEELGEPVDETAVENADNVRKTANEEE